MFCLAIQNDSLIGGYWVMLNKSIANKNKAKRNLLCIIFGFFAVALSLVIIVYNNNYYQIIRDEQYFIDGRYESLKYGSTAKEFFTQFIESDDNSDIKFLYKDLGKRISLHKYYTFYMVDIRCAGDEYQAEKERLSEYIEAGNNEYDMLDNYLINRVVIDDPLYQENYACICFNDTSNTIRYIIFCGLKVDERSTAMIQSVISWHVGKEWDIENQSDIIWRSEDPGVYFSFNENSEYGSEGYLNINDETVPIIVIAGRKNFLYFKDARGYSENTEENYNLFYGIYKYDKSSLILKIKKDYIFDYTYDKIVFNKCEE